MRCAPAGCRVRAPARGTASPGGSWATTGPCWRSTLGRAEAERRRAGSDAEGRRQLRQRLDARQRRADGATAAVEQDRAAATRQSAANVVLGALACGCGAILL